MANQADHTPEEGAAGADDDHGERLAVLEQLESWLERPMQALGFVWLALLILELTRGLSPKPTP
jgi:voltage-gated potassium channel